MKGLRSTLAQTVTMCSTLALVALLCWGGYLGEKMNESLPEIDVDDLFVHAPKVLVHPYVSFGILLINIVVLIRVVCSLVPVWPERKQVSGGVAPKCALRRPVPGWQGVWQDLGRFLGRLSPPVAWDFTPEQASDPGKLTQHLIEGCLVYPDENQQLLALYWGLACAYRATVEYSQKTVVEAGTQTASEDTGVEIGTATTTAKVAPVVKKKQWTRRTTGPYPRLVRDVEEEEEHDQQAGPSTRRQEEGVTELKQEAETTRSLTSSELRDLRKDYSRQIGERIVTWLLRCWDTGADTQQLEGKEAQQLGSLARNRGIERGIGKEAAICSLWRRLLSSVKARYPFKEDLMNATSSGKWSTADEGIQYLRELAVLEVIYGDLDDDEHPKDPEDVQCTRAMWRKVIKNAPASYSASLAAMYYPQMDNPTVETVSSWLQNFEESLGTSTSLRASALDIRSPPRNQPVRGKGSPRRMPRGALWFFLRDQGEDMRKWDGEPTFKLEARVQELRGKTAVKKGPSKKTINAVSVEAQEGNRRSRRYRKNKINSTEPDEGTSGLTQQGSDSEYSDQEQE